MTSINISVAGVLIGLTVLGVLFYLGIVIPGTYSHGCPFQTPASIAWRDLWKVGSHNIVTLRLVTAGSSPHGHLTRSLALTTLDHLWEVIRCQMFHALVKLSITDQLWMPQGDIDYRYIVGPLERTQELKRLECLTAITWKSFPGTRWWVTGTIEPDTERVMPPPFRQRPSAIQKLGRWVVLKHRHTPALFGGSVNGLDQKQHNRMNRRFPSTITGYTSSLMWFYMLF